MDFLLFVLSEKVLAISNSFFLVAMGDRTSVTNHSRGRSQRTSEQVEADSHFPMSFSLSLKTASSSTAAALCFPETHEHNTGRAGGGEQVEQVEVSLSWRTQVYLRSRRRSMNEDIWKSLIRTSGDLKAEQMLG